MITSKKEYLEYLQADAEANGKRRKYRIPWIDIIWKQLRMLRKYEYHLNCMKGKSRIFVTTFDRIKYKKLCVLTGIQISPNSFGKGLTIYHHGYIICNPSVKGGDFVTLQCGVNIAENVVIGDNCYLAPGVKIAKNVIVPDNCVIGYNSVVTKSLEFSSSTYVGSPAKLIDRVGYVEDGVRRQL